MDTISPSATPDTTRIRPETQLLYYWHVILKRKWLVVGFTAVLSLTVAVTSVLSPKVYRAGATIEIAPKAPVVWRQGESVSDMVPEVWILDKYYATQYALIVSSRVMTEAVRRLQEEHGVTDFDGLAAPDQALRGMVSVSPRSSTNLVVINVETTNPQNAQLFANVVADAYIDANLDRTLDASKQALAWLAEQQRVYRDRRYTSDAKVHDYRTKHGLGAAEGLNTTVDTQTKLQDAWSDAHTRRVIAESRYEELVRIGKSPDWKSLATNLSDGDPVLTSLLARDEELRQERTTLSSKYRGEHPEMVRVDDELAGLREQIRAKLDGMIAAQRTGVELAQAEEQRLTDELDATSKTLDSRGEDLIQLGFLEGDADRNEMFYRSLDERMTEVGLAQFMQGNNIRMIDEARLPTGAVRPNVTSNVLSAILVGILGGAALALALDMVDATVQSREEVELATGSVMLGVVPMVSKDQFAGLTTEIERSILVYAQPKSSVAECLRTVRTNLQFRAEGKPIRRLLVTSAAPREGKSFITSNLSAIIAMAGVRVLAIDADLRRPTLHKRFQLPNDLGLANVLANDIDWRAAVQPTHVPGLHVLTTGPTPTNPSELLGRSRIEALLDTISGYDMVVIDSPPVNVVSDALVLASLADGALFVVEAARTNRRLISQCAERLREANVPLYGVVVNKLDVRRAGYEYNYYYYDYAYYNENVPEVGRNNRSV